MSNELIIYIATLVLTFCLIYIPIRKYGLTSTLFKNVFFIIVIIYCLIQLIPEIQSIFLIPYFVYSNIFDYIKTGKLLPIG